MQILQTTIEVLLDTRRIKKNGTYPLKLRVTYRQEQRLYSLRMEMTEEHYKVFKILGDRKHSLYKSCTVSERRELELMKRRSDKVLFASQELIYQLACFTFEDFETLLNRGNLKKVNVYAIYQEEIDRHTELEKIGTADSVRCSMRSLMAYRRKLEFYQVTPEFLRGYERWMIKNGRSKTTVGIYLRSLRKVFNLAIQRGLIPAERYPFVKGKYTIPTGSRTLKALDKDQVLLLSKYTPRDKFEEHAKDVWFMSLYCNGANIIDLANLTRANIDGNMLRFLRIKTANRTNGGDKQISVPINQFMRHAFKKFGKSSSPYLLSILETGLTAKQERNKIKHCIKMTNKYIRNIALEVGIDPEIAKKITTYTARHTFATLLKRDGASYEEIQESLGHKNLSTTMCYLASFRDEDKQKMNASAFSFLKNP